jgi:hypothetical protein
MTNWNLDPTCTFSASLRMTALGMDFQWQEETSAFKLVYQPIDGGNTLMTSSP